MERDGNTSRSSCSSDSRARSGCTKGGSVRARSGCQAVLCCVGPFRVLGSVVPSCAKRRDSRGSCTECSKLALAQAVLP